MIKLVVSDLDGTLLPKGSPALADEVYDTIRRLKERGIMFAVASGRTYHELKRLLRPVERDIYFISSDGALMVYKETSILEKAVPQGVLKEFFHQAQLQAVPGVLYSGKYITYYTCSCEKFPAYIHKNFNHHVLRISSPDEIPSPVFKVSVYGKTKMDLPDVMSRQLCEVYEGGEWRDFVCPNVDKAAALRILQNQLSVLPGETLVFGDNTNDVQMLRSTPMSYAVGEAKRDAEIAARYRTDDVIQTLKALIL